MTDDGTAPDGVVADSDLGVRRDADAGIARDRDLTVSTTGAAGVDVGRQLLAVGRLTYRLSVRDRWALALAALFGSFTGVVVWFGGAGPGPVRVDALVVSLASLATYLVPLAALVYGYDAVVGAAERGWLDQVFALPVPRWAVVVGTYLGRAATLAAATVVGFGVGALALVVRTDTVTWALFAVVVAGAVALGLAFLAVGVLVSTVAAEKTHALGLSLVVWVWFVFGHDLAALGLVASLDLPHAAVSALIVTNPVDVFRVAVLAGVDGVGGRLTAVVADSGLSRPVLAAAAAAWVVAPVAAAARLVRRRAV